MIHSSLSRRALSWVLTPVGVVVMLVEEYVWYGLKALMARIARHPAIHRVEARIATLSPFWTGVVFVTPILVLFPLKLAAVWAITGGHVLGGVAAIVGAKLTSTALFARLFTICKPTLMTLGWFVRLHGWICAARDWAHAWLERFGVTAALRAVKARVRDLSQAARRLLGRDS